VLELPARWAEPVTALADVDRLLAKAPTDLAVLPEMGLTGYVSPDGDFDLSPFAEPIDGPTMHALAEVAARHSVFLVAPLVLAEGDSLFNTAVVIGPDRRTVAHYRKRHPWFPERWATAGSLPPPLVRVGDLTITIAICFDAHFLEDDAASVLEQADLLVFTSAWVDEEDSRLPLLRALARRFGISIANANWSSGVVRVPGQGGSCILDGRGQVLAVVDPTSGRRADAVIHPRAQR
jgi:predicted amidohydrolase